ncbi:hypothetical protein BC939DRAFT_144748 [Gamsiella multidivaricata]|uniref:uncharacterized protein n=1 Tax=Gamsiella multidivaricata TaxID=101098 RepID=UPI002220CC87|nr:uncharacterized protein BC939DRAFT_144748 [Gamsiella multidivaricata]KAI7831620.1 hypothetical protein BC939DRAFT_144748 [Gamsiella multidivaricata]
MSIVNKSALLFLVALVVLGLISQSADAVTIPAWCTCSNDSTKTQGSCNYAGANWDGGSCGLDSLSKYNVFLQVCATTLHGQYRCWH